MVPSIFPAKNAKPIAKSTTNLDELLQILNRIPFVLFDKVSEKKPCPQIVIDEEEAAFNAVEHLINIGKSRIAILKETENSFNSEKRFAGYLRALKEHQIKVDEKLIRSTEDINLKNGRRLATLALGMKNRPDAIFAITDNTAIGAIKAMRKFNVKIPKEIAVIGFSNSVNSTIVQPELTTVDQPGDKIGRPVKYLIKEIEDPKEEVSVKQLPLKRI